MTNPIPKGPGTKWSMATKPPYICKNCGQDYNSHGCSNSTMYERNGPDHAKHCGDCHLYCPPSKEIMAAWWAIECLGSVAAFKSRVLNDLRTLNKSNRDRIIKAIIKEFGHGGKSAR